jgi:hypothetical protein
VLEEEGWHGSTPALTRPKASAFGITVMTLVQKAQTTIMRGTIP